MRLDEYWDHYTASEKALFRRSCRKLLKSTFIVRAKDEEHRRAYFFISKNPEPFQLYFSYIGFDLGVDRDNGVVMLQNRDDPSESRRIQVNRVQLRKAESIVLCCLWTIYADRLREGRLNQAVLVTFAELIFTLEKYGLRDQIDKRAMSDALNLLKQYNLLDLNGRVGEDDFSIRLYPSLQFALNEAAFLQLAKDASVRMSGSDLMSEDEDEDEEYEESVQ